MDDQLQLNRAIYTLNRYGLLERGVLIFAIFTFLLNIGQIVFGVFGRELLDFRWSLISFISAPILFLSLYILSEMHCKHAKKNLQVYETFKALYKTSRDKKLYKSLRLYLELEKPHHVLNNFNSTLITGIIAFLISGFYLIL